MEPYLYHRNCKNFIDVCHGSLSRKVIFSDKSAINKDNVIEEKKNRNLVVGSNPILSLQGKTATNTVNTLVCGCFS